MSRRPVQFGVLGGRQHLKVLDPVVEFVPVDVVDMFIAPKAPAQVPLHNDAMFTVTEFADPKPQIAVIVNGTRALLAADAMRPTMPRPQQVVGVTQPARRMQLVAARNGAQHRTKLQLQHFLGVAVPQPSGVMHLAPAARINGFAAVANRAGLHTTKIIGVVRS